MSSSVTTVSPSSSIGHTTASNRTTPSTVSPLTNFPKKGLYANHGKGNLRKNRKRLLRDNLAGITKPAIRRLARRGKNIPRGTFPNIHRRAFHHFYETISVAAPLHETV